MRKHIPNLVTCSNLLCGALAVFLATQGLFSYAFCAILLGAFFDFFDGLLARQLGVSGPMGVQMDSLADDITFGLAPAMMLFCYLRPLIGIWSIGALLMAAFSAIRLAKFNIDTRQTTSFIGLATPANAIFWGGIVSMPYALANPILPNVDIIPWGLLALSLLSCFLLVAEIPFFSLKMKHPNWKEHRTQFIFLIGCLLIVLFCTLRAIQYHHWEFFLFSGTGCILWYITINLIPKRK